MLKISILMYDAILHNDTGVNSKVPLAYLPPEGGGLRSGAVHRQVLPKLPGRIGKPYYAPAATHAALGGVGEARPGTWSLEKEKREKNSRTPTLVIYSIIYSIDYRRVKESFADWAGGCVQTIAYVPLSAGLPRSERSAKRDGIEAGKE